MEVREPVKIDVIAAPPPHRGYGSKTALILAVAVACDALFELGLSEDELRVLSGRGAASGVGVHVFFSGGVVWDCGHRASDVHTLLPSSAGSPAAIPHVLTRFDFPAGWRVALFTMPATGAHGEEELQFFRNNTPIPRLEALETMALVAHGLVPALQLKNYSDLREAMNRLQRVGFKKLEIDQQPRPVRRLLDILYENGIAAGMSSLGPLVFGIYEPRSGSEERASEIAKQSGMEFIGFAQPCNEGHRVRTHP